MAIEVIVEIQGSDNEFDVEVTSTSPDIVVDTQVKVATNSPETIRQDWVSPYLYTGKSPYGTLETSEAWLVYRYEFDISGNFIQRLSAINIKWVDRLTAIYS